MTYFAGSICFSQTLFTSLFGLLALFEEGLRDLDVLTRGARIENS